MNVPCARRIATALLLLAATGARAQSFTAPANVSQSASGSYLPSLTRDRGGPADGTMRLFWHDFTSVPNLAWCSESAAGAFTAGAPCGFNVSRSWSPRAAADSAGVTHVAWRDRNASGEDDILHASFDGLSWSAATNVSRSVQASSNPSIAIDPWNRPHLVWEEATPGGVRYFESHFDGAAWSTPADTGLVYFISDTLRLACDGAGILHAVWETGATSLTEVLHSQRPDGGSWSAPDNLSATPGGYSSQPAIVVGPADDLHVAWAEQDPGSGTFAEICLASRPAGGGWSPWQPITSLRGDAYHPSIALGSDGVPRVAFGSGPPGDREVLYVASPSAMPVNVSVSPGVDSNRTALLLGDLDAPWIAWQEGSAPIPEIFVAGPGGAPPAPIILRVTRSGPDVVLDWTGGAAPFIASRSNAAGAPLPWTEITPAGGIPSPQWTDAGVAGDGVLWHYLID